MEKVIKNATKCKLCGEVLESRSVHDFKTCKCGNLSVDGGLAYIRRVYKSKDSFEDLSIVENEDDK